MTRFYGSLSVYSRPLPSEKITPLQSSEKSPFGDSCFLNLVSDDSFLNNGRKQATQQLGRNKRLQEQLLKLPPPGSEGHCRES